MHSGVAAMAIGVGGVGHDGDDGGDDGDDEDVARVNALDARATHTRRHAASARGSFINI